MSALGGSVHRRRSIAQFQALTRCIRDLYLTHTNEEVLEPWIQWVTVHTGVPLSEHGIKDLDEAEKVTHNTFWDGLAGENVLLMSPMNVKFRRRNQSLFMPDPWAASQVPSAELEPFYNFVRAAVNSHARTDRLDLKVAARAMRFLLAHGLTLNTLAAAFRQLFVEKFGRRDAKWRRATILDRLLWDVFTHFWRGPRQPRVGIFFSNATAHYQHKYWSHHDPSLFSLKPNAAEVETYGNVIRFGYQAHDRLIGKAMALAGPGTAIALCTALSQQPMLDYEVRGGKQMFLVKDFAALQAALGVSATARAEALMAEESWLHFATEAEAADGYRKISSTKNPATAVRYSSCEDSTASRSSLVAACSPAKWMRIRPSLTRRARRCPSVNTSCKWKR